MTNFEENDEIFENLKDFWKFKGKKKEWNVEKIGKCS